MNAEFEMSYLGKLSFFSWYEICESQGRYGNASSQVCEGAIGKIWHGRLQLSYESI